MQNAVQESPRTCRVCGCTDHHCSGCIERTGQPCRWVAADLCSACAPHPDWCLCTACVGRMMRSTGIPAEMVRS